MIVSPYLRDLRIIDVIMDGGGRGMPYRVVDDDDRLYFLKAFNKPKIIMDLTDDAMRREQKEICRAFERKQENLYMSSSTAQAECDELVTFHDFFNYRGVYYAVYDYIDLVGGGDLDHEGLHTRVFLLADAAAGLARLHAFGVYHGDVKPANIAVYRGYDDREGKDGQPALRGKLIDYDGGCLLKEPPPLAFRLLDFDDVYAAPEFLKFLSGEPGISLSPAMDVFALSMTAARVLVGDLPFEPVEAIAGGADPMSHLKLGDLPPPLSALVVRGLSLDPAARPTAKDFGDQLSNWLGRRPVSARTRQKLSPVRYTPTARPRRGSQISAEPVERLVRSAPAGGSRTGAIPGSRVRPRSVPHAGASATRLPPPIPRRLTDD